MMLNLAAVGYGLAAAAFLLLFLLLVTSWRGRLQGAMLAGATALTACWAALHGWQALLGETGPGASLLEVLRDAAWLAFLLDLLLVAGAAQQPGGRVRRIAWSLGGVLTVLVAAGTLLHPALVLRLAPQPEPAAVLLVRVALAVVGLALVEQLYRNTRAEMRWGIKYLCLGLGALFAYDFYLYADAMLLKHVDRDLWAARGYVNALVVPMLAVSAARNPQWSLDVFVSRRIVFHTAALLGAGIYLLLMAGAGYYIRFFGGRWGNVLQAVFLFGAMVLLVLLLASGTLRSRLKVLLSKHFFSYRFDYREEWLRFTRTLSEAEPGVPLRERSIRAIAELVESPGGALWLAQESGRFERVAYWNYSAASGTEPAASPFCEFLERRQWVIEMGQWRELPGLYEDLEMPQWLAAIPDAWLVVPLIFHERLLGFVVLARSRAPQKVDWEVSDLLKTAGRQAAGNLAQVEAAEALVVARQFESFSRMSAFVIHDLKNLVAQLSLLLANAAKHKDNPEFQADMLSTVEYSVDKMKRLLTQLHSRSATGMNPTQIALADMLRQIAQGKAVPGVQPEVEADGEPINVVADRERLGRVVGHVVQNAVEAVKPQVGRVRVRLAHRGRYAMIEVEDDGAGMEPDFVRDRLFRPFDSTKGSGMGVGAYECREYVRELGGHVQVDSAPGRGTRFGIFLPLAQPVEQASQEQVEVSG